MTSARIRYRITFRSEDESGFHQSGTRASGTLWGVVQEINDLLASGAEIVSIKKECWSSERLSQQEKDTIEMLTHGRVKL